MDLRNSQRLGNISKGKGHLQTDDFDACKKVTLRVTSSPKMFSGLHLQVCLFNMGFPAIKFSLVLLFDCPEITRFMLCIMSTTTTYSPLHTLKVRSGIYYCLYPSVCLRTTSSGPNFSFLPTDSAGHRQPSVRIGLRSFTLGWLPQTVRGTNSLR